MTSVTCANSVYLYRHLLLYISQGEIQKMKTTADVLSIVIFIAGYRILMKKTTKIIKYALSG